MIGALRKDNSCDGRLGHIASNLAVALILFIGGCERLLGPSGGGSTHIPPESIHYSQVTPLRLELSRWGNYSGKIEKSYTSIQCQYRVRGAKKYTAIPMQVSAVDQQKQKTMVTTCDLPAFAPGQGDALEYYFDFYFDGEYNQRETPEKPFSVPLR